MKFGIIGCGHIGKRHAAVLDANDQAKLVALCDVKIEEAEGLADMYGLEQVYKDHTEVFGLDLDVVIICTPHYLHKEMTIQFLEHGKHVIVEKPMALTGQDARQMTTRAKELGLKLYVVKQNRFNVPIIVADEAIQKERLGKIYLVQCNVLWNRHQDYYRQSDWRGCKEKEGGALFTQASHFIDILVWWFGDVINAKTIVNTQHHDIEIEDAGLAVVEFDTGVMGSLSWTTNVYNKNYEGSITIIGEKGTIKIGGAYLNRIESWDVQSFPLPDDITFSDQPNNYGKYQGSSSNHHRVLEEVIKDLSGQKSNIVEGKEGERSILAIETIYHSI